MRNLLNKNKVLTMDKSTKLLPLFPILVTFLFFSACLQDPVKLEDNFLKINSFWKTDSSESLLDTIPLKSLDNAYSVAKIAGIKQNLSDFNKSLLEFSSSNAAILSSWISINFSMLDYLENIMKFQKKSKSTIASMPSFDLNSMSEENCPSFLELSASLASLIQQSDSINSSFDSFYAQNPKLFNSKSSLIDNSALVGFKGLLEEANSNFSNLCTFNSKIFSWVESFGEENICDNVDSLEKQIIELESMKLIIKDIVQNELFSADSELDSTYFSFEQQAEEFGKVYASLKYACEPQ